MKKIHRTFQAPYKIPSALLFNKGLMIPFPSMYSYDLVKEGVDMVGS
jgi:hypothetical protein